MSERAFSNKGDGVGGVTGAAIHSGCGQAGPPASLLLPSSAPSIATARLDLIDLDLPRRPKCSGESENPDI